MGVPGGAPERRPGLRVQSSQAKDHVREFNAALTPWRREPTVREFIHRTRKELGVAA
ncbi:hypothetical protein [Streptomyces atratus]|uniref:hypothetical protein n=1 Tax=Streptomyces atratus TaxID=1893 RepID=UPI00225A697A|nr:hypothetical protein [Streptomyces atratus]MCX5343683.1 hypothetical protein [Streptomyces atratus]